MRQITVSHFKSVARRPKNTHTNRTAFDEKLTREHVLLNAGSLPFSLTGEER